MRRLRRWHPGLRTRVTLAFAFGALMLSLVLCTLSYGLVRNYLVSQREDAAVREAYLNARLTREGLRAREPDVPRVLSSLQGPSTSPSVLFYHGDWFSTSLEVGRETIPDQLRNVVSAGQPARQAYRLEGGEPVLTIGLPLPLVGAEYFEVFPLAEVERTLNFLAFALLGAGMATTVVGAAIGRWASTRLLRPLTEVAHAAASIAGGRLETRLEPVQDPDLARLISSFNSMVDALATRIERDARFASDISHELRSPLTTVATSVQVLAARRRDLPERAVAALDLLEADVARFQRLVEDLLEISRSDAGVTELRLEKVRLAELVPRAVELSAAPQVPVECSSDDAGRAVIQADKRRLVQVIANLVENAGRYGGGVTRIVIDGEPGVARVMVDDAGPGVPEDEREAVFERFFRGSAAGRRRGGGQGSGLGLALVAEHVRLHGGRVWVEDAPGPRGARFVIELPVASGADEEEDE